MASPGILPESSCMPRCWLGALGVGLMLLLAPQAAGGDVFPVADFGAVGDGRADDGPAIRRAIAAALAAGPESRVVLEPKTYRLGERADHDVQFAFDGAAGITIDGGGAMLVNTPKNGLFAIHKSRDVTIRRVTVDYDPLPFTQGTIQTIDPAGGTIDVEWQPGYPLPPDDDAAYKQKHGPKGWDWGSVMHPVGRHLRWGSKDFTMVKAVVPLREAARTSRISVDEPTPKPLESLRPGDRFVLPLRYPREAAGSFGIGANIIVEQSEDCLLEDITMHSGRSGMVCAIVRNDGLVTLRRMAITFRPDTDRLITTWKDGMHCKDNRIGPVIESCFFEGMLDDSINLGANTAMAKDVLSPTAFRLTHGMFEPGESVLVITPLGDARPFTTTVAAVRDEPQGRIVTLADAVPGKVVPGRMRPHEDVPATHFYNTSRCNRGFIVRGCTFLPQRRHAMLVRAPDGLIEENVIDGVGGAAVWAGNEIGSFYEGPFPTGITMRGNRIRRTQGTPIVITSWIKSGADPITGQISVQDNDITPPPGRPGVLIERARDVVVVNNAIHDAAGKTLGDGGIRTTESVNVTIKNPR